MAELRPESLREHYQAFLRADRVLLTGHSHQAWPDRAREGLLEAFDVAAQHVDDKWARAQSVADEVRQGVAERIDARAEDVALGASTHELVSRFLSALDWSRGRHLVTTRGEFHALWRQLRRLTEEGIEVTFVEPEPLDTLSARLAAAVREDTVALLASTVLFETSALVPDLHRAVRAAQRVGAEVLLDAYHAFGIVPFRVQDYGPDPVFVTAGGYKYAQWGEGCCFLRVPPGTGLRPVYTGWFADFASLDDSREHPEAPVRYGDTGASRFAGSTYDPASHFRARAVLRFFQEHGLTLERLRALSLEQTGRILSGLQDWDVVTPQAPERRGGFVAVRTPNASEVVASMRNEGFWVDARGSLVRLGPAPYTTDEEIDRGLRVFRRVAGRHT
jgi:selenocysteine lyase/cysteine desulfurase